MGQPRDTYRILSKALLRKYMEKQQWSVRDLAAACGVQKSIIHELASLDERWPNGRKVKTTCSRTLAKEIERNLGVDDEILFEPVVRQTVDTPKRTTDKRRAA